MLFKHEVSEAIEEEEDEELELEEDDPLLR
jgi:hypothetical protein